MYIYPVHVMGLISTKLGKRDLENKIIDCGLRKKERHSKCSTFRRSIHR